MSRSYSAALPILYVLLRILIVLNWLLAVAIIVLLTVMPTERWIMTSLDLVPGADADRVIIGLHAIALVGLATIPINYMILKRLLAIVVTVRMGDPFVPDNAHRLQAIAWCILALQLLGLVIAGISKAISTPDHPIDMGGFSVNGWLAVLLTFVLARIFAEGTLMREDLEGTV